MEPDPVIRVLVTVALVVTVTLPLPAQEAGAGIELLPIGHARISAVYDLDAAPPYAYALERQNLRVLDVRDPASVREVAQLPFEGPRSRSLLYGSHLYLVGFGAAMAVVDISDPHTPRWLGELPDLNGTLVASIVDDVLWIVRDEAGLILEALDPRDRPGRPRRLAAVDLATDVTGGIRILGVSHDAGRLFMLVGRRAAPRDEIVVVDVRDSRAPAVERRIPLPEGAVFNDLAVRGDLCYLVTRAPDGLAVYRLRGSEEPELLGSVSDPRLWYGADLILRDDVIHVSFKGEVILATFDVADPTRPSLAHAFVPDGWTSAGLGFSVSGDRLYLSGDPGPSPIFDIGEPRAPRYLGKWAYYGGWAADLSEASGDVMTVLNRWSGAYVYDVADPRRPVRLARHDRGATRVRVAAHGNRLLVTSDSLSAELLDLNDPSAPALIGRIEPSGVVSAVELTSEHALLGYDGGIEVVDLATPRARFEFALSGEVTDIVASNDRAVAAGADGGLVVIDLTGEPRIVARVSAHHEAGNASGSWHTDAALSEGGDLVITVQGEAETDSGTVILTVHELGDASGARVLGRLTLERGYAERFPVVVSDGEALVALGTDLARIDLTDPRRPRLSGRYRLKMTMAAEGLARRGRVVFVGAAEDGLLVFELPGS